jgi:uncharacterized membrane protein YraQ (UPF0718 family)
MTGVPLAVSQQASITLQSVLLGGWHALIDYIWNHTFTCLVPAFFIAGAISTFISKDAVMKYFGPQANKVLSYSVASISGAILAVCSCTVLPLFGGIYRRGAGLGPAIAFLYSGPAINVLAIVYTARLLGFQFGLVRAIGAVAFAALIGLAMAFIFRKEEKERARNAQPAAAAFAADGGGVSDARRLVFLINLVAILITATSKLADMYKWPLVALEIIFVVLMARFWFERAEVRHWLNETWSLAKLITPVLLVGVFAAGVIGVVLPPQWIASTVGGNSFLANLLASVSGALMYFATLTEVPILKTLLTLGMGNGPALALLLAGPALSLPSMLAIQRIIGTKKMLTYVSLVVAVSTLAGMVFGAYAG